MSDKTPENPDGTVSSEEQQIVPPEPVPAHSAAAASAPLPAPGTEPTELVEPPAAAPTDDAQVDPHETGVAEPAVTAQSERIAPTESAEPVVPADQAVPADPALQTAPDAQPLTPSQTVYVHAPVPPVKRGNRAIGSLIALGSAVIFAAIYAAVVLAIVPVFAPPRAVGFEFLHFIASAAFFIPVLVFAGGFILLVLIANRANWWAYILGSLFVGAFVYFVSIGILLLVNGVIAMTPSEAVRAFHSALKSPIIIAASLIAREVALWMGAAIAARGRKMKARNVQVRADYDRDTARARADYDRAVAANAVQ